MILHPIYTESTNCQDCFKCIRECPVKAIRVERGIASIIPDECIYCGHCVTICPAEAKKVREDIRAVKTLLASGQKMVASLAPSWVAEFSEFSAAQMVSALTALGFSVVSETAIGAEIVTEQWPEYFASHRQDVYVSQCCPVVVDLLRKHHPTSVNYQLKLDSPMLAHGKWLKNKLGEDCKVVFIGPCIAKKKEAEKHPWVDFAITFKRLRKWLSDSDLSPETLADASGEFWPFSSVHGSRYPIEGGMIGSIKSLASTPDIRYMGFSGMRQIPRILEQLDELAKQGPVFLELMACEGGCINGPACTQGSSTALRQLRVMATEKPASELVPRNWSMLNYSNDYQYITTLGAKPFNALEIDEILRAIGKNSLADELNCGGCGYESCRDFARSMLEGKSERDMCVSYMRRVAQNKATVLLKRMPFGVVMVNEQLRIIESNQVFAQLLGNEAVLAFEEQPGLEGASLKQFFTEYRYFEQLLHSGAEFIEKDIRSSASYFHLSVFTVQKGHVLCGILQNLRAPELNREEVVKRAKQVIDENLATVQKIAHYLGQNAAKTETLLQSIVKFHADDDYDC